MSDMSPSAEERIDAAWGEPGWHKRTPILVSLINQAARDARREAFEEVLVLWRSTDEVGIEKAIRARMEEE